jgi:transcriptional regulator with XRE-family HTH domain
MKILGKNEVKQNIAKNLKWLMEDRGLTQTALADASCVSQPRIHKILRAAVLPNPCDLANVAGSFGVTTDFLIRGKAR